MRLLTQIKTDHRNIHWARDLFGGIVVGLVSIPISMGYAQIAGLPPVYGLYGSLLPILFFGLLTTSRQFVVGVDAMPAVMVGSLLAQMGVAAESKEALSLVPIMALFVAAWFLVLCLLKAGRIVKYISMPVMGGFISGVGLTIILMQVPKLWGGAPGTGEVIALFQNMWEQRGVFHPLSFALGFGTVAIILFCKKRIPKVPMTVVMMVAGAVLQGVCHLDQFGVKVMAPVGSGLPRVMLPGFGSTAEGATRFFVVGTGLTESDLVHFGLLDFSLILGWLPDLMMQSLGIAAVVMAQTLLASGNYAKKYQDEMDANAELLAYGAMNFASALVGACPINGSVSRSGIADSQGVRSQVMSIAAAGTMLLVLLFGTPFLRFLPVPILTGIVITALIGILETKMAKKLWRIRKNECTIFVVAFLGVLFFGTLYGVIIGVVLSFGEVAMRAVVPPTAFVGRIPGHGNFYSLKRNTAARPIKNTVIYRFSGNLFFANVELFCSEIENALKEDTHQVVVDARGIGSLDSTAVERLVQFYKGLREKGVLFYMTEHDGSLNDQLRVLGGDVLIDEGAVRRTITLALRDAGVEKPYELEEIGYIQESGEIQASGIRFEQEGEEAEMPENGVVHESGEEQKPKVTLAEDMAVAASFEADERLSEFEWLFGDEAQEKMEELARSFAERIAAAGEEEEKVEAQVLNEEGVRTSWGMLGRFDEDEFWDFMELWLEELAGKGRITPEMAARVERHIEKRRDFGRQKLEEMNPHAARLLAKHGEVIRNYVKRKHPEEYEKYLEMRGRK